MTQDTGNQDGVQWGPEIVVIGGERPSFLKADDFIEWRKPGIAKGEWRGPCTAGDHNWRSYIHTAGTETCSIRLPANHPYYATLKQEEKPTRTPAQVARMEALVRLLAGAGDVAKMTQEARAIVAELDPVDGDLVEARRIATSCSEVNRDYTDGKSDDAIAVKAALAALKRGRELQKRGEG